MKKFLLLLLSSFLLISAYAQTNHLVISQVYGAGGNSGALFRNDFVELYNPTASAINISGWSLQYAGAASDNWHTGKVDLSGTVAPGKYFLIQLASGGSIGATLPAPDLASTNISMSFAAGKLALVSNTVTLTGNCPSSAGIVDFIGYGTSADCNETANAPATAAALAIFRINNGCTDNNNNSSDFIQLAPSPRNSASPANTCNSGGIAIGTISPLPFCVDGVNAASAVVQFSATGSFSNANFSVELSNSNGSFTPATVVGSLQVSGADPSGSINITIPANAVSGTAYRLRIMSDNPSLTGNQTAALEIVNGAKNVSGFSSYPGPSQVTLNWINPAGCFEEMLIVAKEGSAVSGTPSGDGSSYTADLNFTGNGTAFGGGKVVYKGAASGQTVTGLTLGTNYYFKIFTRRGTQWSSGIELTDVTRYLPQPGEIIINQFSPDYAEASDEYVEIVNTTNKTFQLSDVQFGYQNSSGNARLNEDLHGVLGPHRYWLLSPDETITVGKTVAISRDDAIISGLALNGQIALLRKADGAIIDAVAYGSITGGNYTEGSSAPNAPADGGLKRIMEGADNNANNTDFVTVPNSEIDLRNSSSMLANEGAHIAAGTYARMYVSGNAAITGNVVLSEKLVLLNGVLRLDNFDLETEDAVGGNASSYIKTNSAGSLTIRNIIAGAKKFPVGNSTWNPISISNGNGLNWKVRIEDAVQAVSSTRLVLRTWHVAPSASPLSGANLIFEYNDGDANQISAAFNKGEDIQVWNFHDNKWQSAGLVVTPTGDTNGPRTVTLNNWMQFSPFALANVSGPLPIYFYGERAVYKNAAVQITWSNLAEEHVQHYTVERSPDGIHFTETGTVLPAKNNGTNAVYHFTDAVKEAGKIYYRIKAVEVDGSITYSKILSVKIEDPTFFLIYPNPASTRVLTYKINNLAQGNYMLTVYNAAGQIAHTESLGHAGGLLNKTLAASGLTRGVYYLVISGPVTLQKQFVLE